MKWLSLPHNVIQQSLYSGYAQVQILLGVSEVILLAIIFIIIISIIIIIIIIFNLLCKTIRGAMSYLTAISASDVLTPGIFWKVKLNSIFHFGFVSTIVFHNLFKLLIHVIFSFTISKIFKAHIFLER